MEPSGFMDFLAIAPSRECHGALLKALAERWWDTTNTFHFSYGELTMTPTDLTLITGLHFDPRALEFYDDWRVLSSECMMGLLGFDPPRDSICVPRSWLRERIAALGGLEGLMMEEDQSARLMILMILGCSFLHTRRDTVNLNILRSLGDLAAVGEYDWAGAALGTMYREMSDVSRGIFHSFGGMHFAWEVCINSVLLFFFVAFFSFICLLSFPFTFCRHGPMSICPSLLRHYFSLGSIPFLQGVDGTFAIGLMPGR